MRDDPTVFVMVGLPGSGKSTYLNFVDDPEFSDTVFVYSTDNVLEKLAAKSGKTYNEVFKENIGFATKLMDDLLKNAILMGVDVYWDQTCLSVKKRKSVLSKFPASYRKVCICRVLPRNEDEWAELNRRLASREGKNIPSHIVESMADSYVEPTLDEGFDEVRLFDIYGNSL
jgi:predicted kinase